MPMLLASDEPRVAIAVAFGLAFPAIVYCLLAGIWVIRVTQRMLSGHLR